MRSPSFKHPGSKAGVLALVAFAVLAPAFADGDLSVGLGGVRFYNGFIPSGLDLTLSYSGLALTEDAETILFLKAGGGYQNALLMRDPANGNPWTTNAEGVAFKTPNFQWEFAFLQGLARRDDGKNLVEAFLFYRGRYDRYLTEGLGVSAFSDIEGLLGTSFMAGLSLDSLSMSRHRALRGAYAELAGEWGPGAINAGTDFWRVSAQFRGFLPLVDLPSEGGNLFNIYAAGFAGADYADGASVPLYVNQSFGGRNLRDSLGDCVRGYGWNRFDSSFKAVANAELRLVGPAILIDAVVPYLYGFVDAGYYAGFASSADFADAAGFIASTGGGLALDLAGFAQAGLMAGVRLLEPGVAYVYAPGDFFWGIKFFLHF